MKEVASILLASAVLTGFAYKEDLNALNYRYAMKHKDQAA
jgi:hypothetical protein